MRFRIGMILFSLLWSFSLGAQSTMLEGQILDTDKQPIVQALIYTLGQEGETVFVQTNSEGKFQLELDTSEETYVVISHVSFVSDTIAVTDIDGPMTITLKQSENLLDEVYITGRSDRESMETPLSINSVDASVIQKTPGSGSDINRVMLTLPGVTATSSFRNDLIIRGGAPSENAFFVDGIRVPVINHLATQGASGGTISILNADLIRNADLISGSFEANHENALSSEFRFDLIDGNRDQFRFRAGLGANNMTFAANGPMGDKGTFVASIGRSYRQYILKLLGLAIFPVYNDFLVKLKYRPTDNNELTLLGVGAIDKFRVNEDVNSSEIQRFLVDNLPENDQWNYTIGLKNQYFTRSGVWEVTASRSELFNAANREVTSGGSSETTLKYESKEINHRFATEYVTETRIGKLRAGLIGTHRQSEYDVFNLFFNTNGPVVADFQSSVNYWMYGGHVQLSRAIIPGKWDVSVGARVDGATYAKQLNNPFRQTSPRISTSVHLTERLSLNGSAGIYYQLPSDVTLAFKVNDTLANQAAVEYIRSNQYVLGARYELPWDATFKAEVFRKDYSQYPFNLRDSISQANEGGQFGVAGNSPIISNGRGRAQGFELMYSQDLFKGWFGTFSYTFSKSEFEDAYGNLVPSTWDTRHIVNLLAGKKLKKNWQVGFNLRYQSAPPFTPFDAQTSSLVVVWDVNREGIRDFSQLNAERGKQTLFIDFRADKTWNLNWGQLTFYLDLENVLADADSQQVLVQDLTDSNGNPVEEPVIVNPNDPPLEQRYKLKEIRNAEGVLIPTFGFILDF